MNPVQWCFDLGIRIFSDIGRVIHFGTIIDRHELTLCGLFIRPSAGRTPLGLIHHYVGEYPVVQSVPLRLSPSPLHADLELY